MCPARVQERHHVRRPEGFSPWHRIPERYYSMEFSGPIWDQLRTALALNGPLNATTTTKTTSIMNLFVARSLCLQISNGTFWSYTVTRELLENNNWENT